MRAIGIYCNSADELPGPEHVPYVDGIDLPTSEGKRTYRWNQELRGILAPALRRAWDDLQRLDGSLRFSHDAYLKIWALSHQRLFADFILFDEAQDASPVMAAVINEQADTQVVAVGDPNQAIYEWRGAIDAVAAFVGERTRLSQSFRFGPEVAEVANEVLAMLGDAQVRGSDSIASVVAPIADPDAILCRTNAVAVDSVLTAQQMGKVPHLVGGGAEVVSFAKAAKELQETGRTWHPELACFDSWGEVADYVAHDELGGELRLMVSLVEKYGVPTILKALDHMPSESDADVVVSTAHKSKGREWNAVQLAGDFPGCSGTSAAFSGGGSGGDYLAGGMREGQARYEGTARAATITWSCRPPSTYRHRPGRTQRAPRRTEGRHVLGGRAWLSDESRHGQSGVTYRVTVPEAVSQDQRDEALRLYEEFGPAEASRRTGIKRATISQWARREGLVTARLATTEAARDAARKQWDRRRLVEADEAGEAASYLRQRTLELAKDGKAGDARHMAVAYAIMIDKAQLLSGEVTGRQAFSLPEVPKQAPATPAEVVAEGRERALALVTTRASESD